MHMRTLPATLSLLTLSGCGVAGAIHGIGRTPALSPVTITQPVPAAPTLANPAIAAAAPTASPAAAGGHGSLYAGPVDLYGDRRAARVGDIVTIRVSLDDKADFLNNTEASRSGDHSGGLSALFGLEKVAKSVAGIDTANLIGTTSKMDSVGKGSIQRQEKLTFTLSAVVTKVLANGNLVVSGSQETRVNSELRELVLTGIVRPEDIAPDNSVTHDRIAELRMSYGGKGQLTQVQRPGWGQQALDALAPF